MLVDEIIKTDQYNALTLRRDNYLGGRLIADKEDGRRKVQEVVGSSMRNHVRASVKNIPKDIQQKQPIAENSDFQEPHKTETAAREWYESGVREVQYLRNFVEQEARKVKFNVNRRRKAKFMKAPKARQSRLGRKWKSGKIRDRKLSKDISEGTISQETTDLYNFLDPGKMLSKGSLSKESKGKETMEKRSTDSQEEVAKAKGSTESLKKVGSKEEQ